MVPGSSYVVERWVDWNNLMLPVMLTKAVDYFAANGNFLATRKLYLWESAKVDPTAPLPCPVAVRSEGENVVFLDNDCRVMGRLPILTTRNLDEYRANYDLSLVVESLFDILEIQETFTSGKA